MVVKDGDRTLKEDTDYTLSITDNVHKGTAYVKVTGKGNYKGTKSTSFAINAKELESAMVSTPEDMEYTGAQLKPEVRVTDGDKLLVKGTDYTLSYSSNTDAGTAKVTVTGKGDYASSVDKEFTITPKSISGVNLSQIADATYTGSAIIPVVTVRDGSTMLSKDKDYTVTGAKNVNVGTAELVITGQGNYKGTAKASFKIVPAQISNMSISKPADMAYTGSVCMPEVVIKNGNTVLTMDEDYVLTYSNNTKVGTAQILIEGKGNYTGSKTIYFNITGKSIEEGELTVDASRTYTGSPLKPAVTVKVKGKTLTENTDYSVSYSDNTNVGTATVTVSGKGNYSGTLTGSFTITPKSIAEATVAKVADRLYTGKIIKPAPVVTDKTKTLVKGTDYSVTYSGCKAVGTATITITGKGNYTGTTKTTFRIYRPDIVYSAYVQKEGQLSDVKNGGYAGTKGKALRLELIKIKLGQPVGGVSYRTYVQKQGWTSWAKDGAANGMKDRRLEAFQLKLTGSIASSYDVYYRVYAQRFGWLGWAKNGESSGTAGYGYRLEGVQIKLLSKTGDKPLTNTKNTFERKSN